MFKKIAIGAASVVASLVGISSAHAASLLTIPTSTATDALASASDTIADPGLLLVILAVIALPVAFWVIRKVVGLFPKGR